MALFYFECDEGCGVTEASTATAARLLLDHRFGSRGRVTDIREATLDDLIHIAQAHGFIPNKYLRMMGLRYA